MSYYESVFDAKYKKQGYVPIKNGFPDRFVVTPEGKLIGVEIKAHLNDDLQPNQYHCNRVLVKNGIECFVSVPPNYELIPLNEFSFYQKEHYLPSELPRHCLKVNPRLKITPTQAKFLIEVDLFPCGVKLTKEAKEQIDEALFYLKCDGVLITDTFLSFKVMRVRKDKTLKVIYKTLYYKENLIDVCPEVSKITGSPFLQ